MDRDQQAAAAIAVRRASPADAVVVAGLLFDFNTEFGSPTPPSAVFAARFGRLLALEDVIVLLAEKATEAVGLAFLTLRPTPYGDGPVAQLEELYVRPALRGGGIGTAMLDRALFEVRTREAVEIQINVDEPDLGARRFYERHGFSDLQTGTDGRMLCYIREL